MRATDLPTRYNAVDILERNLERRAEEPALLSAERTMTFAEVAAEVNRVTNALRRLDVRMGESVAILAHDRPEWITGFFGILKAGAVAVCMNTLLTPKEHGFMLDDSRARVLLLDASFLPVLDDLCAAAPLLEHVIVLGAAEERRGIAYDDWIGGEATACDPAPTHRDDFGTLNYSSGTTGEPKGIFHAHKDYPLTAELYGANVLGLTAVDRTFSNAKLFFVYGLGGNLIFPWYVGGSTVLFSGSPRDTARVLDTIARFEPTVFFNTPTGYRAMLSAMAGKGTDAVSSLRLGVSAGEALPAPLWHEWKEATGIDVLDGIGSTENFHVFLSNRPGDVRPGSSGKPVEGYELRIVDEEGKDVAPGEVGNLWVRGETAAQFYLHQYERSRQVFLGPWLNTGDKYRVDEDGYYWHAGRSDDMLKVGGVWVSPVEVESTLVSHPAVAECAVVGMADESGLIKPKAWVTLLDGAEPSNDLADQLVAHCTEHMAGFKRPRWIEFVDELPKTATGKIQRYKLRDAGMD